jgi:fumarate hydratase class II
MDRRSIMSAHRVERDTFGELYVPADRLWGASTQRSLQFFAIGEDRMPLEVVRALALIKGCAATVNAELGLLDSAKAHAIAEAASEIVEGRHDGEFPLSTWQTGSGTQTNMNVNEVIANLASERLGGPRGMQRLVHPNDDVNRGQSSNDTFPTAMHVAVVLAAHERLLPSGAALAGLLAERAAAFGAIIKIGRTHLQDATPITLGQEFSGYHAQLAQCLMLAEHAIGELYELAIGGTAVGTGVNTHPQFGARVAAKLAQATGRPFVAGRNRFALLAAHDALVHVHGTLKTLATALTKIANDIRWMASGPRAGLGEIAIPENEPGSSIMPGKVNPTQCEALTMVCAQVMGNDVAVSIAGASGNFELNVYKPLIARNVLHSVRLLGDAMASFGTHCIAGIEPIPARARELLDRSLMLVTALAPHIGYENAAAIAKTAHAHGQSLREAALQSGHVSAEQFDAWVRPERMLEPDSAG